MSKKLLIFFVNEQVVTFLMSFREMELSPDVENIKISFCCQKNKHCVVMLTLIFVSGTLAYFTCPQSTNTLRKSKVSVEQVVVKSVHRGVLDYKQHLLLIVGHWLQIMSPRCCL